jgi:nitrogen fixation NifU-like protein
VGEGQDARRGETIRNTQIAEELALPPVKIHCSILAEDAIKAADRRLSQEVRRRPRRGKAARLTWRSL